MERSKNYKWESPNDWLGSTIDKLYRYGQYERLYQMALAIAHEVDADTIQDLFQDEMDEDGYFEEEK